MRFLIIGLGIYGSNLAIDLTNLGHEVIGADRNSSLVEAIKNNISTAYILDATDQIALEVLPLKNVDVVIVAIGENFGASVKTVAILKSLGVKHIYARAIDALHESILRSFEIDRILTPEQRAATDLVNEMGIGGDVVSIAVDQNDAFVMKFKVPQMFLNMRYESLNLKKMYGLTLVAVSRLMPNVNVLGISHLRYQMIELTPDTEVAEQDMMVCLGTSKAYHALCRDIAYEKG